MKKLANAFYQGQFRSCLQRDQYECTPLIRAIENNDLAAFERLIMMGSEINIQNMFDDTPLSRAVVRERPETVSKLLACGADPNMRKRFDFTAVHTAAGMNNLEIMKLLVEHGGDIHAVNDDGLGVLHFIAIAFETKWRESWELTKWLLRQGADPKAVDNRGYSVCDKFYHYDWSYAAKFCDIVFEVTGEEIDFEY